MPWIKFAPSAWILGLGTLTNRVSIGGVCATGGISYKRGDTVGEPISTRYGPVCCVEFSRFLYLQQRHMRGTIFGTGGFANSIRGVVSYAGGQFVVLRVIARDLDCQVTHSARL